MAPNQTKPAARGRPAGSSTGASKSKTNNPSKAKASTSSRAATSSRAQQSAMDIDPFADSQPEEEDDTMEAGAEEVEIDDVDEGDEEDEDEPKKTIPPELLTRLLHSFFEKDGTRISKNANEAVAKYMDIFVREAIARAAVEKESGFLEVQDLEKVAPQLLFDV